jgi:hypothetical protein
MAFDFLSAAEFFDAAKLDCNDCRVTARSKRAEEVTIALL